MELQGLYELHERLGAAAVAGVNLIGDDFRLRRACLLYTSLSILGISMPILLALFGTLETFLG